MRRTTGRAWSVAAGAIAMMLGSACLLRPDARYCERDEDCQPGQVCDLLGSPASGGHAHTCVAADAACAPDGACPIECADDAACAGELTGLRCLESGACGCVDSGHCAGGRVCDGGQCRPCTAHGQCDAGVCHAGACVLADEVAHVARDGVDRPACGASAEYACKTITAALGRGTPWIRVAGGRHAGSVIIEGGRAVALLGDDGAILAPTRAGLPVIDVHGADTRVYLEGVTVQGASGSVPGLRCLEGASLHVYRVRVVDGASGAVGIRAELGCDLRVERAHVRGNDGAGVVVSDASFTVQNSVIAQNNGASLVHTAGAGARRAILRFNTIADNAAGLSCTARIDATHNLLWRNQAGAPVARDEIGQCIDGVSPDHSIIYGRDFADPGVSAASDYRLASGSPAVDAAETWPSEVIEDMDGEPRPLGARADIGADELAP